MKAHDLSSFLSPLLPASKDKTLFTPGPLTTSRTVKQAMLRDLGSRDEEFVALVADIRARLLQLTGADPAHYTAILMQGSGTFGVESVLGSTLAAEGKLLVAVNGAYGRRMVQMAHVLQIPVITVESGEDQQVEPAAIAHALQSDPAITHVAIVHCETTTGIFNPIEAVGQVVAEAGNVDPNVDPVGSVGKTSKVYIVDAMSSFGAVPIDLAASHIDYLLTSSNKCIEGVPGFAIVLARRAHLLTTNGYARSVSLDLLAQYQGLETTGQFRFTPPTHALLAFHQALLELEAEGGVEGRARRYQQNYALLCAGMDALGFRRYLAPQHQGYIISAFHYPKHPHFNFASFYAALSARGHLIYPGKLSQVDCFRVGHIGRIFTADVEALLAAIRATLAEMQVELPEASG